MQRPSSPGPTFTLGNRPVPYFRALGALGLAAATAVSLTAAARGGAAGLGFQALLVGVGALTFLGLAMAEKVAAGRETLVYYHHEIAILLVIALVSWAAGRPVLAHLDASALGLGAFLAFGRVGCFCAGCCHGRPARAGCVYGQAHVREGFPAHLAGRTLIPVQLAEAAFAACLVGAGFAVVGEPAGRALGLYVTGYALARFALEGLRGDDGRPFWHGLSAARWTSLAVVASMAALAAVGALSGFTEHLLALVLLAAAAIWVARRAAPERWRPLDPRQVARLRRSAPSLAGSGPPRVVELGAGVRMSAGRTDGVEHVTLSRAGETLEDADAASLAILVAEPSGAADVECVAGVAGTFHVLLRGPTPRAHRTGASGR